MIKKEKRASIHTTLPSPPGAPGWPLCGGEMLEGDRLVEAALESDCDNCRAKAMVGPMNQRGCELRQAPNYVPEPHPDADAIFEEKKRRVDGR